MRLIESIWTKALSTSKRKKHQQQFLWLISTVLIAFIFLKDHTSSTELKIILCSLSVFFVAISFIRPVIIIGPLVVWNLFSLILSEITSALFLGIIYFTLISLIRLLTRRQKTPQSWVDRDKFNNFDEMF